MIPDGNPDGLARFEPGSLLGMRRADLRFWGQGTWADGSLVGWPAAKRRHPMTGDDVGHLGAYFDDAGVNPMHDEFFDPMGPSAPAILEVSRREAPDVAVSLHSYAQPPTSPPTFFNLVSAIHHVSGATVTLFENPHGLEGPNALQTTHEAILEMQLGLYEVLFRAAIEDARAE